MGEKKGVLHIYVARTIFLQFYDDFMVTKTLNPSNWKYKRAYLIQYSPIYISKALWKNYIHTLQNGRKYWHNFSYFCSCIHNSAIL